MKEQNICTLTKLHESLNPPKRFNSCWIILVNVNISKRSSNFINGTGIWIWSNQFNPAIKKKNLKLNIEVN